ncbi:hypothetical protein DFH09DRAFT_1048253, partial [Mycena vulgaris]
MVQAFLADVLGWESEERGIFGHTKAYYATVEQQGRLTLHAHSLIWVENALSPQEIRDRIMGPSSRFRRRLIAYLEDCHKAEYFNGSRDAVITKRKVEPLEPDDDSDDEIYWASEYRPPTQTFAKPPPARCRSSTCPKDCVRCAKNADWWDGYQLQVDDLLVRSNVHTHYLSKVPDFKIRRERKGCLTRLGICRARFPRDVFQSSEISPDGHINVRHIEPMVNTVNPILTYVSRCNSDVTSLLSGTAIKAVVSYVSDYVSKLSLKSFQMFASVYDVFQKKSEMIGGSLRDKEQARHMVRKMVNSMSAKMEIGSPMASMYLLGNPDHYASHKYATFAWRPYVQFIRSYWVPTSAIDELEEDEKDEEERVPIARQDSKFVPSSGVDNYRYRPLVYNNVTLYEWIQCSEKKKRGVRERADFEQELRWAKYLRADYHRAAMKRLAEEGEDILSDGDDNLEDDYFEDLLNFEDTYGQGGPNSDVLWEDDVSDWETDDEDNVIIDKQARIDKAKKQVRHAFTPEHDLFLSHSVTCRFENLTQVIPNFIGGALPRADKGDRAAYCMAMLVLFKPWRSPADLKDVVSTWDQAFKEHEFTDRQKQLMGNFNLRYECNDARDDHFAQMKKKLAEAKAAGRSLFPSSFLTFKDKFADDLNEIDYGSDDDEMGDQDEDSVQKGPKTLKLLAEAKILTEIMETSGWLDSCPDKLPVVEMDRLMPPYKPRAEWTNIIKEQRAALTANKLADLPPEAARKNKKDQNGNKITILPHDYFNRRSGISVEANADIVSDVVKKFKLNTEQIRAFKIVADHAT